LSGAQRDDLITLLLGSVANDVDTLARTLLRMGTPMDRVDISAFKAEISRMRSEHLPVGTVEELDTGLFIQEFMSAAQRFRIKVAVEYSVMAKSIATLEGLVQSLHPKADFLAIAREYAEPLVRKRYSPERLVGEALTGVTGIGSLFRNLPGQIDQVLHDVETGRLRIEPELGELNELPSMLHSSTSRVCMALFAMAMSICAAVLIPDDPTTFYHVPILGVLTALVAMGAWTVLWLWHFVGLGRPLRVSAFLKFFRRSS